jgi:hypothetical protein
VVVIILKVRIPLGILGIVKHAVGKIGVVFPCLGVHVEYAIIWNGLGETVVFGWSRGKAAGDGVVTW